MQTCGATRVLLPAAFVGLVVSVFAQSEVLAWVAAILTGLIVAAVGRVRGRSLSCAITPGDVAPARPDAVTTSSTTPVAADASTRHEPHVDGPLTTSPPEAIRVR